MKHLFSFDHLNMKGLFFAEPDSQRYPENLTVRKIPFLSYTYYAAALFRRTDKLTEMAFVK